MDSKLQLEHAASITIPVECRLTHLVADQEFQLAHGHLTLIEPFPTENSPEDKSPAADDILLLILQVAEATFRIQRTTPFGTTTASPFTYLFRPDVPGLPPGYMKLSFPSTLADAFPSVADSDQETSTSTPELEELRDLFEQVLVDLDILSDSSVLVAADDFSRSAVEGSRILARHLGPHERIPQTDNQPPSLDSAPVRGARALEHGTLTFSEYSARLADILGRWSEKAGSQIGRALGTSGQGSRNDGSQGPSAYDIASQVGSQLKDGFAESGRVVSQAVGDSIISKAAAASEDDNAPSVQVLSSLGHSIKNIGAVAGNGFLVTSAVNHSARLATGAAEAGVKQTASQTDGSHQEN